MHTILWLQGRFDPRESLSANTSLSGPLLSRFDVLLILRDRKNPAWDAAVAAHILDFGRNDEGAEAQADGPVKFSPPTAMASGFGLDPWLAESFLGQLRNIRMG